MSSWLLVLGSSLFGCALGMAIGWWLWRRECRRVHRVALPALKEREFRVALQVGEDNLLWRAVHQAIETQREAAIAVAVDVDLQEKPQLLSYYNGAIIHLEKLGEFLRVERERGLREVEED